MNIYAEELEVEKRPRVNHPVYKGTNGFFPDHKTPPAENERPSQEVLDQHRMTQFILTQKDRPIPSLEEMKEALKQPETIESLKEQIDLVKKQHAEDLERLYALEAEEYLDEAYDRYLSKDDLLYLSEGENNAEIKASYEHLASLYENGRYETYALETWGNDYELLRYTHLSTLRSLNKRLADREERERREVPTSIEEFEKKSEDIQRRVVLYLTSSDNMQRDRRLTEFGWSSLQIEPLWRIYKTDRKFQADIVGRKLAMDTSSDPRLKRKTSI